FPFLLAVLLLLVSIVLQRPLVSILFPYTTLFRSLVRDGAGDGLADPPGGVGGKAETAGTVKLFGRLDQADVALLDQVQESQVVADRKSTRLNSSHVSMSYAVFCLKKKIL